MLDSNTAVAFVVLLLGPPAVAISASVGAALFPAQFKHGWARAKALLGQGRVDPAGYQPFG